MTLRGKAVDSFVATQTFLNYDTFISNICGYMHQHCILNELLNTCGITSLNQEYSWK